MSAERRPATRGPDEQEGSYTARPSDEPPPERVTRDEDEEAVERTGGEHGAARRDGPSGSRGEGRVPPDGAGAG